jgi:hypothetical protein
MHQVGLRHRPPQAGRMAATGKGAIGGDGMKVQIRPIATDAGTRYAIIPAFSPEPIAVFDTVTEAQMHCLRYGIPFEPWGV